MTEKDLAPDQDPLSDSAATQNLASFLNEIGAAPDDIQNTSEFNRRVIADVPLTLRLEPLTVRSEPASERDRLVNYFEENNWLPKQLQEANIAAVKGVHETLRRARHTSSGNQVEAQVQTHATVKRYFQDALHDVRTLNLVRTRREGRVMEPNIESLRVSRPALYTMSDMLLAREFLDNAQWANSNWEHYIERQHFWRGFILFSAEYASDDVLANTFNYFYDKAQNRRKFWSEEFKEIDRKIGGLATEKPNQSEEPAEIVVGPDDEAPVQTEGSINFEELIPEGAKKDLERAIQEYADRSAQIDRYVDDQGMYRPEAERRVLRGRAIYYQGQVVGVEGKEEKTLVPGRSTRRPKTRRGLHGHGLMNADEPPPGIPDARRDRTG